MILLLVVQSAQAWNWWPLPMAEADTCRDTIRYRMEATAVTGTGQFAPFWLQTARNGEIAATAHSGNLTVGIEKEATRPNRWWDYDFAVTLSGQFAKQSRAYTNNCYAHVRLYIVDVTVGIHPLNFQHGDELLSGGGLLFSTNARPMPRVSIGIDRWTAVPGLYGYLEIKGGISQMMQWDNRYIQRGYVHHKYIGARLGGKLPVRLSYQFHHAAQWGGYSPVYGDLGNDMHALWNAFKAGSGGTMANDQLNAQGNHLGEQQLALEVEVNDWTATAYWHHIFEDGPIRFIGFGMNNRDGLWGINIRQKRWPFIESVSYELLHTTDQSGPYHDRDGFIYGGSDNYYCNGIYLNGWSYFGRTLGNAFITSPVYSGTYGTTNNRVWAHLVGARGNIFGYRYRVLCSYAKNYGQYYTNPGSQLLSTNTAWLLEVSKHVEKAWGLDFSVSLAGDAGSQFGNTFGVMLSVKKIGILYQK